MRPNYGLIIRQLLNFRGGIDLATFRKENVIRLSYGKYPMAWINDHLVKSCTSFAHRVTATGQEFVDFECVATDELHIARGQDPAEDRTGRSGLAPLQPVRVMQLAASVAVHYFGDECIPAAKVQERYDLEDWVVIKFSVPINPPFTRLVVEWGVLVHTLEPERGVHG